MGPMVNESYLETFKGKRVLVTGHTGFKGSWLALILKSLGAEVMGYALAPAYRGGHFELLDLERTISHVVGDVRDLNSLSDAVRRFEPEIVFHLAAQAIVRESYADPKSTFDINVGGSVNLLEAVRTCDSVRALVYITSDKCYENVEWIWAYRENDALGGRDPYSASKAAAEIVFSSYLRSYFAERPQFGAGSARAGNVIGGGDWAVDRIVPDCVRALLSSQPIVLRNPSATRPWQHVLEPLAGYLTLAQGLLLDGERHAQAWNFGPDASSVASVETVVRTLAQRWPSSAKWRVDAAEHPHEASLLALDSSKARQLLGWQPRWTLHEALEQTLDWHLAWQGGQDMYRFTREQIANYQGEMND